MSTSVPSAADNVGNQRPGAVPPASLADQRSVIWVLWLTYGAFYFCRTNISVAVPGLKGSLEEGGLALSAEQVGWILASLKISYALGQLINGQLSERFSPRVMLALGMFGSAALNVLFGLSESFYFLLFVWATNGFCQSLGWTPVVRVAANWVPVAGRGNAIGIIATGYQVTLGLTYLIAGQSAQMLGWRGALYVPAALLAAAGVFMLVCLREKPSRRSATEPESRSAAEATASVSFAEALYWTLFNPTLWLLGLALGLLNSCRYGFLDWGVTHLMETQKLPVNKATLQFFVIAIGAVAGSYLAGWATDRFFGSRRAPVICILMAVLAGLSLVYESTAGSGSIATLPLLVMIGFCIYGPQVLLVGTAPADLAHRGTSAAAAGFVNFMGYMGAATGDVVTGYYSSPDHGGWEVAIHIWAAWALGGAAITAVLWNTTSRKVGLIPGSVPKVAAIIALLVAGTAMSISEQSLLLCGSTFAAAVILCASFVSPWAALPAIVVSTTGLLLIFVSYVRMQSPITWEETVAMATCGLAMIASLMILVERKDNSCV